jgi:hypothetical protein
MHTQQELTPELASRMAVAAVTTDIEFWARTTCVDGHVGINDLIRTLDVIREASAAESWFVGNSAARGEVSHE